MMDETSAAVDSLIADLSSESPETSSGELPVLWSSFEQLGLTGVGLAEEAGGSGGDLADLVDLATSIGRHVASSPLIEHSTAQWVLSEANVPAPSGVLTVALLPADVVLNQAGDPATVHEVPWARHASALLVVSTAGSHIIDLQHESIQIAPQVNEAGEPRDDVTFGSGAAVAIPSAPDASAIANRLGLLWAAALAGAIEGTYGMTRDYVNEREQFDAPLIRIPAVAGLLATIKAELVQVEAALDRAERRVSNGIDTTEATTAVATARVIAGRASTIAARLAHQLHGGMGITAEYPLHRYTTRLWSWRDEAGSEKQWATLLGTAALELGEDAMWNVLTSA